MAESPLELVPPTSSPLGFSPALLANFAVGVPDVDTDKCRLMGSFALAIQALMGVVVLGSLFLKRQRERPRRKYRIWAADVSKQVMGQAFVHALNVFISSRIASLPSGGNACALYFINIVVDTTVGVLILWLALRLCTHVLSVTLDLPLASLGLISGIYPTPFLQSWSRQLAVYVTALTLMKSCVVMTFVVGGQQLVRFGDHLVDSISSDAKIQVLVSIMIGPTILNVVQFLLIDSFIKNRSQDHLLPEFLESEEDEEALLREEEEEEDEVGFGRGNDQVDEVGKSRRRSFHQSRPSPRGSKRVNELDSMRDSHSYPPPTNTFEEGQQVEWDDDSWADWNDDQHDDDISNHDQQQQVTKLNSPRHFQQQRKKPFKVVTNSKTVASEGPNSTQTPMTPTIVISEAF